MSENIDSHDPRRYCELCIQTKTPKKCLDWEIVEIGIYGGPVSCVGPARFVKCRKEHDCQICFDPISEGSHARYEAISIAGQILSFYTCMKCVREHDHKCRYICRNIE